MINLVPAAGYATFKAKVLAMKPLCYWPLDDVADTEANNATPDGPIYDGRRDNVGQRRIFYGTLSAENFFDTPIDIYGTDLNANLNRNGEGSIVLWFRVITKQDWEPAAVMRLIQIRCDDNNRIIIQINTAGVLQCFRIARGDVQTLTHDFSGTKPLEWISVALTTSNQEVKLYINGTQSGSTATYAPRMLGNLDTGSCAIGGSGPTGSGTAGQNCRNLWMAHVAIFNRGLPQSDVTAFATPPAYVETVTLTHEIVKKWDIFSLFSITGSSMAVFAEDVDGDDELEFVGNIGRRPRFTAVKQNGTILWDTTVSATQSEGLRYPFLRSGVIYYGWTNHACAINAVTGATIWNKTPMASPPTSGLGGMNYCSLGVVMGVGNKLDVLDFTTGNSIGGNYPVTLPFDQWEQSLAVGIFGTSTEVIICNDNFNNMICFNVIGTIRFQKGPLVGTVNWVNENDWYEFFDYQNTGSKVLGLVGDDNASSTQPALEGDEFHIYGNTGTQLDKYDTGITTGGLEFHSYAWPNGGRVVFTLESNYPNRRLTMLDHNLNVVWIRDVGNPYEGDQCILLDVDGDGHPEILFSTQVFSHDGLGTEGFRVAHWSDGNPVLFFTEDSPIVPDDIVDGKGAAVNIHVSRAPYTWWNGAAADTFIQFTCRTTDNTCHEMIYLHKWTP